MEEKQSAPRYRIAVHRAQGCYFARVIEIPGCVCRGSTQVEAVENARGAIRAYLWVAQCSRGSPRWWSWRSRPEPGRSPRRNSRGCVL